MRWQVRKTAPFPIEEAQISYVAGQQTPEGQEFVVSLARRDVIVEYEQLAAAEGAHAGIVDLATFNVINAVLAAHDPRPAAPAGDWLLVNVAPDYVTLAILRGPHLIFFRNRAAETDGTLADLVHQTAMYYEDRLSGGGFARVLLAGAAGGGARHADEVELVRRSLQDRLAATVDTVDPRAAVTLTDRISAGPAFLDTLAPLVGVLLRGQEPASPERKSRDPRQPLDAAFLQRARRAALAARAGRSSWPSRRSSTSPASSAIRRPTRSWPPRPRATRRARRTFAPKRPACAAAWTCSRSSSRRSRRARPTS